MSILIKGMEMPENCAECPCRMIGYTQDYCNVLGKFIDFAVGSEGRREDCPLVPVPPHGRLIDADALLASENQHYEYHSDSFYVETRTIELAPTVIPADKDGET